MHPRKILHPTDYSKLSERALHAAAALAHDNDAELVLLHAVQTLGPEKLTYGEMVKRQPEALRKRLWEELHLRRPPDSRIHVEYVLSEEEPATAILRTAVVLNCDLIVMATHGLTGWERWVTGSIAEQVVQRAPCSVLVVKPPRPTVELPPLQATDLNPGYLVEKEDGVSVPDGPP